ncbi:MAG: TRAP transporter large permease subunit [Pseudomonadota bacterium]|nr:TRAP transporter large permease subunit [Pseudomonadota bacterium]
MENLITKLDRLGIAVTRRVAFGGVLLMLLIAMVTIADVFLRTVANAPIVAMNEITEVFFAVAIAACFPAGLTQRIHVTVDLLATRFGVRLTAWLKVVGALLLLWLFALITWRLGAIAAALTETSETTIILQIPTWPFIWLVAVFSGLGALFQIVVLGVEILSALRVGARSTAPRDINRSLTVILFSAILGTVVVVWGFADAVALISTVTKAAPVTVAFIIFGLVWVLLLCIIPIAASVGLLGVIGIALLLGPGQSMSVFATGTHEFITNSQISVLPLFLMMGVLAAAAGLAEDIYNLAHSVLGGLRGGLALATIGGCAGFGAVTGSSIATAATIGKVALPEMNRRGYATGLSTGCVAAGGTLGALVPPSGVLVMYSFLTEVSIGQLFVAAIIPGLLAALLYMLTVGIYVRVVPSSAPPAHSVNWGEMGRAFRRGVTVIGLFVLVMGGIYTGIFTATEAASVGAVAAFLIALYRGRLKGAAFWNVMGETASITAMIYALIIGGLTFSFFVGITGLPELLVETVGNLDLAPKVIVGIFMVIFILLGAVMEAMAILIITVPILAGLITDMGFDLIWWGIVMVAVVEIGVITPPFGVNVFVLKSMAGADVPLGTVFRGVMPFVFSAFIKLALLVLIPALALWLPSTMF